jgi:anti-anti-sigma factor
MEATIRKDDERRVTLILDGRLDTSVTQQTEKEVEPLFDYKDFEVVIDCSRLEYISSSGLRLLMAIDQRLCANHCDIYIKGLSPVVQDVFQTTGFVNLFKIKK